MNRDTDLAQRFRAMLRRRGYWKGDRPDAGRFCREKGYFPQSVYSWLKGVEPNHSSLRRLAQDLQCNLEWLVTGTGDPLRPSGEDAGRPTSGPRPGQAMRAAGKGGKPSLGALDATPLRGLREIAERLERLEAGLQAFFQISPDLLLWLDREGRLLGASPGKGVEPAPGDRQAGERIWDLFPPPFGRPWREALSRVRATGKPHRFEQQVPFQGRMRSRECRLVPVRHHGFLALIRDITELRAMQGGSGELKAKS